MHTPHHLHTCIDCHVIHPDGDDCSFDDCALAHEGPEHCLSGPVRRPPDLLMDAARRCDEAGYASRPREEILCALSHQLGELARLIDTGLFFAPDYKKEARDRFADMLALRHALWS